MDHQPRIGLFITCLVDLHRPEIAFASIKLLEAAGCHVEVPRQQTCCGQPAFNAGDRENARKLALSVLDAFESYDYVIIPSGSCAGMISKHYSDLFSEDPNLSARIAALSARTFELMAFLVDIRGFKPSPPSLPEIVTIHDSCAGLRELGVKAQPRQLLSQVPDLTLVEMTEPELCCGFGGTFCIKYPEISTRMVDDKIKDIESTGAKLVVAGDLGCLLNIAGRLQRTNSSIEVRHIAELLT